MNVQKGNSDDRKVRVEDLVFLRTHPKSGATFGAIKKMLLLYAGPYLCYHKPSLKVVRLIDPDSGKDLGPQAEENCKIKIPSLEIQEK